MSAPRGGREPSSAEPPDPATVALELLRWMEARAWRGHDPFDFLSSPVAAPLRRLRWPAVAWTQLGRRLPVDLRRVLAVPPHRNPKALALGLRGCLALERTGVDPGGLPAAALAAGLIEAEAAGGGWGYPFPWANRHFLAPAGTPSSVVTAFVGHALLDAAEATGAGGGASAGAAPGGQGSALGPEPGGAERAPAPARHSALRDAALRGAAFVAERLARIPSPGGFLFGYTPLDRRGVHNASALAASLLARSSREPGGDARWADLAREAGAATLRAQRPDGSWPYGTSARDAFVDAFHTGYVLEALTEVDRSAGLDGTGPAVAAGLARWREDFLIGPAVAHRPGRPYPVELHAVAQGMLTCLAFADDWPDGVGHARRLARWACARARRPDGAFAHLWSPGRMNRIAYLRWVQAWMFRALATLVEVEGGESAPGSVRP